MPQLVAIVLHAAALVAMPAAMLAQAPAARVRLTGLTLDHWRGAAGPALLRPTLRLTAYTGGGPAGDFALVIFPDGISIRPPVLAVGLQAGMAQPVPAGPITLLPKVGAAGIAIAGILDARPALHLIPGVYGGVGLLVPVDGKSAVRLDLTRHLYRRDGFSRSFWSFGVGFAVVRRGVRPGAPTP